MYVANAAHALETFCIKLKDFVDRYYSSNKKKVAGCFFTWYRRHDPVKVLHSKSSLSAKCI